MENPQTGVFLVTHLVQTLALSGSRPNPDKGWEARCDIVCSLPIQGDSGPEGDPGLTVRTSKHFLSLEYQQKHTEDVMDLMI